MLTPLEKAYRASVENAYKQKRMIQVAQKGKNNWMDVVLKVKFIWTRFDYRIKP